MTIVKQSVTIIITFKVCSRHTDHRQLYCTFTRTHATQQKVTQLRFRATKLKETWLQRTLIFSSSLDPCEIIRARVHFTRSIWGNPLFVRAPERAFIKRKENVPRMYIYVVHGDVRSILRFPNAAICSRLLNCIGFHRRFLLCKHKWYKSVYFFFAAPRLFFLIER